MKGSEGNLAFPSMLKRAVRQFQPLHRRGRHRTDETAARGLSVAQHELDEQLRKWEQIKKMTSKSKRVNQTGGLPALIITKRRKANNERRLKDGRSP